MGVVVTRSHPFLTLHQSPLIKFLEITPAYDHMLLFYSQVIREAQKQKNLTFPAPAGREYILRTTVNLPRESSRPSPQRLFTVITPEEFRLAGAFTRDTTFI